MKKNFIYVFTFALGLAFLVMSFGIHTEPKTNTELTLNSLIPNIEAVKISQSGKEDKGNKVLRKLYTKSPINLLQFPAIESRLLYALGLQYQLVNQNIGERKYGNITINSSDLLQVVETFKKLKKGDQLTDWIDAYQICGSDMRGNVRFTGYYSPTIDASYKKTDELNTAVYIAGKEENTYSIVYVKDQEDVYRMRLEGYAYLVFGNGHRELLSYDGNSRTVCNEDGKKSYCPIFAIKSINYKNKPVGASNHVPLTSDITVAVDDEYIPMGSVLMAEIPVVDERGNLIRKDLRFVLAQDKGSAIRGAGHIDLYMGEGEGAKTRIRNMNKYGKVWLLLPKSTDVNTTLAQNLN